jgi:fluoride exporter
MLKYLIVGVGGFVGSVMRFWVGTLLTAKFGTRVPWGTFAVNTTGSFLIGMIVTILVARTDLSPNWRYLIPIGFIGGYTTFSAFEYETFRSFESGDHLIALLNVLGSVVAGFICVWLGVLAGRAIESH